MAQHKRIRAKRYRKHISSNPDAHFFATCSEAHRKAHKDALAGRSSNAWLRMVGMQ